MKHLFLVSIGPVQEFIASARRTRDLHFGSWFLSELSKAAAQEINQQKGYLIFPAPTNMALLQPGNSFNVANKILALIDQDPGKLAVQVRATVFQRLHTIRDKTKGLSFLGERQTIAYRQIDDLVELVWVALPYHENDYHDGRRQLETLMAARKNTYAFQPVAWGKDVPKSSLDGQLESVLLENEYPDRRDSDSEKQRKARLLYERYGAGPAERLSGVDLAQTSRQDRLWFKFSSTSHIATLPFLQRMTLIDAAGKQKLHSDWDAYVKQLEDHGDYPIARTELPYLFASSYSGSLRWRSPL